VIRRGRVPHRALSSDRMRIEIDLPHEVIEQIDRITGSGGRRTFIEETVRALLDRRRRDQGSAVTVEGSQFPPERTTQTRSPDDGT
jgi:Arc/MetJ family transcription regulator